MASLLQKIQTMISADLNRWVDNALGANEPAVFQHHLRELQELQEQLEQELVSVQADLTGLRRRADEQQALVARQDLEVDALLQAGLHEEALAAQDRLNRSRTAAARLTARLEKLEAQYEQMVEAKAQLDARLSTLRQSEPAVTGLLGVARAKQLTAAAMQSLENLAGVGDPDVAQVVDSIRSRLAEAEAQLQMLEQRALAHGETPETLRRKELESQLEARKARLGL